LLGFSIPCILINVFRRLQNTISLLFIGHLTLDPVLMAGFGVGNLTRRIFGTGIIYGVNNTFETYVS